MQQILPSNVCNNLLLIVQFDLTTCEKNIVFS